MINYTAFDTPYSFNKVVRYIWKEGLSKFDRILIFFVAVFYILLTPLFALVLAVQTYRWSQDGTGSIVIVLIIQVMFMSLIVAFPTIFALRAISNGRRTLRIKQFCTDNQFDFQLIGGLDDKSGSLFQRGYARLERNKISGIYSDCAFSVYDYEYTVGSSKYRQTYHFGVAEMTLKRQFPHIMVDNKRDGSIDGLEFDRSQIIELEGDFNNFFTVYGPKEYEIEVLQVLSPSVMTSILDMHESFDIEIIGDKLFIYNRDISKKQTFQAIFNAMEHLSTSTKSVQTTFSMPTQIGDNKPILKRSIWPTVITAVLVLLYLILRYVVQQT